MRIGMVSSCDLCNSPSRVIFETHLKISFILGFQIWLTTLDDLQKSRTKPNRCLPIHRTLGPTFPNVWEDSWRCWEERSLESLYHAGRYNHRSSSTDLHEASERVVLGEREERVSPAHRSHSKVSTYRNRSPDHRDLSPCWINRYYWFLGKESSLIDVQNSSCEHSDRSLRCSCST